MNKLRTAWPYYVLAIVFITVIVMCALWWKEWQTLITGLCSVAAILIAAYIAWRQGMTRLRDELHNARVDRHSNLIMRLYERWDSEWLLRGREAIWRINKNGENLSQKIAEYENTDVYKWLELTAVANFFEDIGFLVKNGHLEPMNLIKDIWENSIRKYYTLYSQYIEQHKQEKVYDNFEWLVNEIDKL